MMGVGKSTIGLNLAKKLSFSFVDMDSIIEKKEGSSINLIFKKKGENYFRIVENRLTLKELENRKNSVISLGGGSFMNKNIREMVKKTSVSFWLDVNINILIGRLVNTKKRPLLAEKNLGDTVKKIYINRKKTYSKADFRIKCGILKPNIITNKILKLYEYSGN